MLYLLQDQFWWHGNADVEMSSNCKPCIQHEGTQAKAPMQPIIATSPLELLHIDFTYIEMTMEMDQLPNVVSILVFCNQFAKHVIAYVTPNQTVNTVVNFCGKDTSQSSEPQPMS